jgi:hypothetical protein
VNKSIVWLDLANRESRLPMFESKLFLKATRIKRALGQQQASETIEKKEVSEDTSSPIPAHFFVKKSIPSGLEELSRSSNALPKRPIAPEFNLLDHPHDHNPPQNGAKNNSYHDSIDLI